MWDMCKLLDQEVDGFDGKIAMASKSLPSFGIFR